MAFVHLHNHSDGSIADAILKPAELAKKAKEMNMSAVALTDHGVMYKIIEFYKACKKEGIKPILGMETYVTPRVNTMKEEKIDSANYHLVLLAENEQGYKNLIKIASDASVNGMYYKPRTDKHKLRQWAEGIIALSACVGGEVQKLILQGEYEKAKESALQYQSIFGEGNFFLELQDHGIKSEEIVREQLMKMSRETGIPLVATNDCHYALPSDYEAHDLLLCIRDKTTVSDEKRMRYDSDQMYFKSQEDMEKLFSYCPEAIENTVKIANRCNVEIEFGKNKLPPFDVPENYSSKRAFLEDLVYKGAKERYKEITPEIDERIQFELDTIERMGYIEYFLIVWDFMKASRKKGILIGPSRGSAAGSIVCYCIRITQIDPLRYNLLFERFLDPSRVSMPDILGIQCEPYYSGVCV